MIMTQASSLKIIFLFLLISLSCSNIENREVVRNSFEIPRLRKQGNTTQLIVEDKPFLILGGELGNSSFTSVAYMAPLWARLNAMNLNTVLAPVYWELIEPKEGQFDFIVLDQLIKEASDRNLKLIFLWFGSWKNSMSSHVPHWVKVDDVRFPRAKDELGISQEILTPFSSNNLKADLKAYEALMTHVKEVNQKKQTIIMMQCENEIGMLPSARDYHPLANKKFGEYVPLELINYLKNNKETLVSEFKKVWEDNGSKTSGTWEDIFGKGKRTDEIFMAWYFSTYTNTIVEAGKKIYALPMYVNAALNRTGRAPGEYPSAGPLPHIMDVWRAAGSSIDFLSPDFYNPDIKFWCDLYTRQSNSLFIPEHRFDESVAVKALYTIGHYESIGFSPFSIESKEYPEKEELGSVYNLLTQLNILISANQGKGMIDGILLDKQNQETVLYFGNYELLVKHSYTLGWEANAIKEIWEPAGAILIHTSDDEFFLAGSGVVITFRNLKDTSMNVGILKDEEGIFENSKWKIVRSLNGDQTHQGRHVRIFRGEYSIQNFPLYNYKK